MKPVGLSIRSVWVRVAQPCVEGGASYDTRSRFSVPFWRQWFDPSVPGVGLRFVKGYK